jgi:hypothetical protein
MPVAVHHVEVEPRRVNDEVVVKVIDVRYDFEKSGPFVSATSVLLRSPMRAHAFASCAASWMATL